MASYLPFFFFQYFTKKKYKSKLREKLGLKTYKFKKGTPTIWLHAVSVGEIKAASNLLKQIKEAYPASTIIVSSITETGHQEAKRSTPFADHHIMLPIDFKSVMNSLLKGLSLDLVLLVETDIWPNFLQACKKRGAKIGLINGKISERSYRRLKKIRPFANWYFSTLDFLLVQDEVYQKRFIDLGFDPKSVKITSNLKLDDSYPTLNNTELKSLKEKLGVGELCITIGSTHEGEEKSLIQEIKPLLKKYPNLKILLVPRHPERNNEVEAFLQQTGLTFGRYSQKDTLHNKQVLLIDTMGFLRTCYQLAQVAIVAGSYTSKVGGHNILEPLWYSTPCLFGPHMQTQAQFVHLVKQAKAGLQTPLKSLKNTLEELFENTSQRRSMGERGRAIFDAASGGTSITFKYLKKMLEDNQVKR